MRGRHVVIAAHRGLEKQARAAILVTGDRRPSEVDERIAITGIVFHGEQQARVGGVKVTFGQGVGAKLVERDGMWMKGRCGNTLRKNEA
jgi:hypothetical protein